MREFEAEASIVDLCTALRGAGDALERGALIERSYSYLIRRNRLRKRPRGVPQLQVIRGGKA